MTPLRLALLLLAVCGVAAWQLTVIPQSLMQMTVGPVLAPAAIVAGLTLVALLYGLSAWRGQQVDLSQEAGQEALPGSTTRLLSLAVLLFAFFCGFNILEASQPSMASRISAGSALKSFIRIILAHPSNVGSFFDSSR